MTALCANTPQPTKLSLRCPISMMLFTPYEHKKAIGKNNHFDVVKTM